MAAEPKKTVPGIDQEAGRIRFDYIKSNYFRVIHIDGVFGGNAPRAGLIHMAIWNERWPIPKQSTFEFNPNGQLGKEIEEERVTRDAIVREVECLLIMDITNAKVIRDWLNEKIANLEKRSEEVH